MRRWWEAREPRERWILAGGGVLAALLALYGFLWRPIASELDGLRQSVAQQRADVAWMRQAAARIRRLEEAGDRTAARPASTGSLLIVVDRSARAAGLSSALKRVDAQGPDKVRVQLEDVGFDRMIAWLGDLEREHGVRPENALVDAGEAPGRVTARLVLGRPS